MRTPLRLFLLVIAVLAPAAPASALTLPNLRGRVRLPGTLPSFVGTARNLGTAPDATRGSALIALRHHDQQGLLRLISRVSNPKSKAYGHYLTSKQFVARYAPRTSSVAAVESFARANGLKVRHVPSNRAYVYVTGSVAQLEQAFATSIRRFSLNGKTVMAPTRAASVPAKLGKLVSDVEGLDTADVARPLSGLETPPAPAYVNAPPQGAYWASSPATGVPGYFGQKTLPNVVRGYTPAQLRGAYGVTKAIRKGLDGRGQTVAVIDAYSSPTIQTDASTWSRKHGLPAPKLDVQDSAIDRDQPEGPTIPTDVPGLGGLNLQDPQGWFGEETLDVEAVHAMAPKAKIVMQAAHSPLNEFLHMAQNQVVSQDKAQIISNSYGGTTDDTDDTSDGYWQQAAAQGIGVYFSSGDDGDQTSGGTDPSSRTVDSGANSPYVTAVGGTTLAVGKKNNRLFETYWGTEDAGLTNGAWDKPTWNSGGGGGTSQVYAEPKYQTGVVPSRFSYYWKGNPNATDPSTQPGRVVPDVAMLGDPNSGFLMGQTQDFDAYAQGNYDLPGDDQHFGQYRIGGTSLSSPLFAGMMALADQAAHRRHGFANPALYALYKRKAFHDIKAPKHGVAVVRTNYLNNTNSSDGTEKRLRTAGTTGTLASIAGYDDSTGLGTPNGLSFLAGLAPHNKLVKRLR